MVLTSFVVGLRLGELRALCRSASALIRVATNAALLGRTGLLAASGMEGENGQPMVVTAHPAANSLAALGQVVEVSEDLQDVAAATLGSGSAFLALAADGICAAAIRRGADDEVARKFAAAAASGAAALLAVQDQAAGVPAWEPLVSPGGITEAGIDWLTRAEVKRSMEDAVHSAVTRAAQVAAAAAAPDARPGPTPPAAQPWQKRAVLIALEGLDGAGKTTAGLRLAHELDKSGHKVLWWPNRTLRPMRHALEDLARQEGYADRFDMLGNDQAQLISAVAKWRELLDLREHLDGDGLVIVDRYKYAHIALTQAFRTGNEDLVRELFEVLPDADVTYYFDVDPAVAAERVHRRGVDSNTADFLADFARAYGELPEFGKFTMLAAGKPADEVFSQLWADLRGRLTGLQQ
jgi:dTMP kinase